MSYDGKIARIPLGASGLYTDDPQTLIPATKLIVAKNISLFENKIEKDFGCRRWNESALPAGIVGFFDWWPDENTQRTICVDSAGAVHRFFNAGNSSVVGLEDDDEDSQEVLRPTEGVTFLACGNEESRNIRKLLIMTGRDPIQVIEGDGTTRRDIENGANDWTGNVQPKKAILYSGRVVAFAGHNIYFSSAIDHEDFTTDSLQFSVNPGAGIEISDIISYKKKLLIFKYPEGVYYLNDSETNTANWKIEPYFEGLQIGAASRFSVIETMDDIVFANSLGTLTSMSAVQQYGDFAKSDVFKNLKIGKFIRQTLSTASGKGRRLMYYPQEQTLYMTYQSLAKGYVDTILQLCMEGNSPRVSITYKDAPLCLGLITDIKGIKRPFYGADDGYIYEMLTEDRHVNGTTYRSEFQTPHMDFSGGDSLLADITKGFDHLEIAYEPTGSFNLTVEMWIDGKLIRTTVITLEGRNQLNSMVLNTGTIEAENSFTKRFPIGGSGRRISIRCYNDAAENFALTAINIYYKILSNQQTIK